jgi:hypothetical protein
MRKLLSIVFILLACGSFGFAQQPTRGFTITFEMDGKKVDTPLTLRIKHNGKLTEINYSPTKPVVFPPIPAGERFDLWVVTDKYVFPFLNMHADDLNVSAWRIGTEQRFFHLDYLEPGGLPPDVKLVYYLIYELPHRGRTRIWIESREPLEGFRK